MTAEAQLALSAVAQSLPGARFAYVFGSVLSDAFGPESDLDVAVDMGRPFGWRERCDLSDELSAAVAREVDLVDLLTADPIIRMQVLRHGRLVVETDRAARYRFEVRTLSEYADLKLDRAPVEQAMLRRRGAQG